MTRSNPDISIVIPAFNESEVIGIVVKSVTILLSSLSYSHEILVIDDGSCDNTSVEAIRAGACVVRHPYNKGNGAAIKTGIRSARGDIIVFMDGDGQHKADDIPKLIAPILEEGYDMVVGARSIEGQASWYRSVANWFYNKLTTYLTDFDIKDLTSGFRAIRRELALQFCYLLPNTFSYPSTLTICIIRAGYSLKYIPIQTERRIGKSKIKLIQDGFRFLLIIAKIAMLFSPLRLFMPMGGLVFFPGFFYAIYKLYIGKPWTIPIVILVSVGTLIVMLGFLAEQVCMLRFQNIDKDYQSEREERNSSICNMDQN